jgi:hypothetical protein
MSCASLFIEKLSFSCVQTDNQDYDKLLTALRILQPKQIQTLWSLIMGLGSWWTIYSMLRRSCWNGLLLKIFNWQLGFKTKLQLWCPRGGGKENQLCKLEDLCAWGQWCRRAEQWAGVLWRRSSNIKLLALVHFNLWSLIVSALRHRAKESVALSYVMVRYFQLDALLEHIAIMKTRHQWRSMFFSWKWCLSTWSCYTYHMQGKVVAWH